MAITVLDLAIYRGAKPDDFERYDGAELARVGLEILGGCVSCEACIAAYNAYPSKDGFWRCAGCIGNKGWDDPAAANKAIFGE